MVSNTELWGNVVKSFIQPSQEKCVWNQLKNNKLAIAIVESRCHEWLAGVLYNMSYVYGGTNASLYIFHGNKNEMFVKDIIAQWSGVTLINLHKDNLSLYDYNTLLTSSKFWEYIESEYVLIFQTDTLILKQIPDFYFQYDYIGAPWTRQWSPGKFVGNGGFSLRRVETMKNICQTEYNQCEKYVYDGSNEDFFFVNKIPQQRLPLSKIAMTFSVEEIYHHSPVGLHKSYHYLSQTELASLLVQLPHLTQTMKTIILEILPKSPINYRDHLITTVKYGADGTYIDVTYTFISIIMSGCTLFKVSNRYFGDPIYNVKKQLIIEFSDGTSLSFKESQFIPLKL